MDNDIIVTAAMFGQEGIRIDYIDKAYQTEEGGLESSLTTQTLGYENLIIDIQAALTDILEDFLLKIRNPPDTLPAGPRLKSFQPGQQPD